jgi:hypothetical protein
MRFAAVVVNQAELERIDDDFAAFAAALEAVEAVAPAVGAFDLPTQATANDSSVANLGGSGW